MHAENPAGGGAPGISVSALQPFAILMVRSYHRFGTSLPILIGIKRQDGKPWRGAFRTGKWIRRALRPGPACRKPARRRFFAPRTRLPSRPVRNGHERQPSPKAPARQASERAWRAMRQPSLKLRLERFHNECGRERDILPEPLDRRTAQTPTTKFGCKTGPPVRLHGERIEAV